MQKYFQNVHPALQLLLLIGICIVCTIILSVFTLILCVPFGISPTELSSAMYENLAFSRLSNVFSQIGMFLIPAILFSYLFYRSPKKYFRLNFSKKDVSLFGLGILLLLTMTPFISWITEWNKNVHLPDTWQNVETFWRTMEEETNVVITFLMNDVSATGLIANIIIIALLPAICEELFFRGVLQQVFIRLFRNAHVGIWVGAFVFSFIHFQMFGFFPRFVLGLILGYSFYYSGSIYMSMIIHFINNALATVLYYLFYSGKLNFDPDNMQEINNSAWIGIISLVFSAVVFYFFLKQSKKNEGHSSPENIV